jgi:hypothetical protein
LNSSKNILRTITFISLLSIETGYSQFLFTPFENESSFKGTWNLSQEVPNFIAAYLREFYKLNVLSATAFLSLAEKNNIDGSDLYDLQSYTIIANEIGFKYVVKGKVIDFDVVRFSAGESNIAGYEAYSCNILVTLQIFDLLENSTAYSGDIESSESNKALGLNLFGMPSDEKKQYLALNKIKFGSDEFNKSVVGETILHLCENLAADIKLIKKELLYPTKANKNNSNLIDTSLNEIKFNVEVIKGQVLTFNETTGEAFINLGSSSNLNLGDELSIYAVADSLFDPTTNEFLGFSDKNIATLKIVEIRGEKLSLAVVKNNLNQVKKGMEVRKLELKKENNN